MSSYNSDRLVKAIHRKTRRMYPVSPMWTI